MIFFGLTALIVFLVSTSPERPVRKIKNYDLSLDASIEIQFKKIRTNGIELNTAIVGPEEGEPVILLHGFPDLWFGWESQLRALAAKGYRVFAPDQRGYGLSDKPDGVENYTQDILVDDIIGLADAVDLDSFYLAGHDFGAMVSWNLAIRYPERVKRLVIINVPHPDVMPKYMKEHLSQLAKSWYAIYFQIPVIPEKTVQLDNYKDMINSMSSNFSEDRLDRYRKNWARPKAMTSMINWYRAAMRNKPDNGKKNLRIDVPTLIIWGKGDVYLEHEMARLSLEYCSEGQLVYFENASHWPHQDQPVEVNNLLFKFLENGR